MCNRHCHGEWPAGCKRVKKMACFCSVGNNRGVSWVTPATGKARWRSDSESLACGGWGRELRAEVWQLPARDRQEEGVRGKVWGELSQGEITNRKGREQKRPAQPSQNKENKRLTFTGVYQTEPTAVLCELRNTISPDGQCPHSPSACNLS